MNGYEKLIMTIQKEGARANPPMLKLGEMLSETECRVGNYILDEDDYYIAEHLTSGYDETVTFNGIVNVSSHNESQSVQIKRQQVTVSHPLKEGDLVIVYKLNDEKYVILEKVVSMDVSV
jgi:hypothetical protein